MCETYYGITYFILLYIVQTSLNLVILSRADIRIVRGQLEYVIGIEKMRTKREKDNIIPVRQFLSHMCAYFMFYWWWVEGKSFGLHTLPITAIYGKTRKFWQWITQKPTTRFSFFVIIWRIRALEVSSVKYITEIAKYLSMGVLP